MWKRFVAMLAVTALLVGSVAFYETKNGRCNDGLFYDVTDIRPDAQLIRVNGEKVSAEEYFYWLDSVCQSLYSYTGGNLDFNAQVTAEMTFGQYAKADAANTAILYAVVREKAEEVGVALTEEDLAALDAQREQYVTYYGGEETYQLQLQLLGVSEEMLRSMDEVPYLANRLYQEFCTAEGKLYPGDDALKAYGEEKGVVTAQLLYFPTAGLDEKGLADMKAKAEDYAAQLHAAQDKLALYETMAAQLGLSFSADGLTFGAQDADPGVYLETAALAVGEVSGVIEGSSGYYVAVRIDTNYAALTEDIFNNYLQDWQDSAKVVYHSKLYDRIDAGALYAGIAKARMALMESLLNQAG